MHNVFSGELHGHRRYQTWNRLCFNVLQQTHHDTSDAHVKYLAACIKNKEWFIPRSHDASATAHNPHELLSTISVSFRKYIVFRASPVAPCFYQIHHKYIDRSNTPVKNNNGINNSKETVRSLYPPSTRWSETPVLNKPYSYVEEMRTNSARSHNDLHSNESNVHVYPFIASLTKSDTVRACGAVAIALGKSVRSKVAL